MPGTFGTPQATSTSRTSVPFSSTSRTARYSVIASRTLARASVSVAPCDQQPGKPGTETLNPSSVCLRAILYFMRPSLTRGGSGLVDQDGYSGEMRLVIEHVRI